MSIEGEAAGDILTGAVIARTVEGDKGGATGAAAVHGSCRNCGATLSGAYCAACGQAAHIHRSLSSLGHDILHGVFHFEGKVWRTLPELFFHPGRLTRRYIDGERAKFISPMALYLFTVFLMFAVFSFTGGPLPHSDMDDDVEVLLNQGSKAADAVASGEVKIGLEAAIQEVDAEIASLEKQLAATDLSAERRTQLERDLESQRSARQGMEAVARGDWSKLASIGRHNGEQDTAGQVGFSLGSAALDEKLRNSLEDVQANPRLLLYKLKTNGYKYSWALIPLSLPFMWLLFFWRRDVHLYDHAVFVTYSITFIMLLLVAMSLLAAARVPVAIWGSGVFLLPIHMYKQLRGAYGLSRFGAFVRLVFLLLATSVVLTIFTLLLLLLGVLG